MSMAFGRPRRLRRMAGPTNGNPSVVLRSEVLSSQIPSSRTHSSPAVVPTRSQASALAILRSAALPIPLYSSTQYLVTFIVRSQRTHSSMTHSTVHSREDLVRRSPCWLDHLSVLHAATCSLFRVPLAVCFPVEMAVGLLNLGLPRQSMVLPRPSACAKIRRATSMSCTNFPMEPSAVR